MIKIAYFFYKILRDYIISRIKKTEYTTYYDDNEANKRAVFYDELNKKDLCDSCKLLINEYIFEAKLRSDIKIEDLGGLELWH